MNVGVMRKTVGHVEKNGDVWGRIATKTARTPESKTHLGREQGGG